MVVTLLMFIASIVLMQGKGANLIAGFNTMSEKAKEKYDSAAMCRFIGRYLLSLTIFQACSLALGGKYRWLIWAYVAYAIISVICVIIYCNTGNRFKK